jgi:hypothetical protein
MAKNLIPGIAKMLGVELGEKFEIKGYKGLVYKFVDDELIVNSTDDKGCSGLTANMTLVSLLKGKREIVKLPWKLKKGDVYYTFELLGDKWVVRSFWWGGFPNEYALLDKGWVYRTREEAVAALPAVAEELGVEYEI